MTAVTGSNQQQSGQKKDDTQKTGLEHKENEQGRTGDMNRPDGQNPDMDDDAKKHI